jgi:protein subunit release factor B
MKKELLFSLSKKDFDIQTIRGHGAGGQHRNTTDSAVRIIHKESGAQGYSQDERSQHVNKKKAFTRCCESIKFRLWLNQKVFDMDHKVDIEKEVDRMMLEDPILEEFKNEKGEWEKFETSEREVEQSD